MIILARYCRKSSTLLPFFALMLVLAPLPGMAQDQDKEVVTKTGKSAEQANSKSESIAAHVIDKPGSSTDVLDVAARIKKIELIEQSLGKRLRDGGRDAARTIWQEIDQQVQTLPDTVAVATYLTKRGSDAEFFFARNTAARPHKLYERALAIIDKEIGQDAPQAIYLNLHLANHYRQSDPAKAEKYFAQTLKITEDNFGPNDAQVARVIEPYQTFEESQKHWDKAKQLAKRMIDIYDKMLEANNLRAASARDKYADLCISHGRSTEAEGLYHAAITNYSNTMGAESIMVAVNYDGLGNVLLKAGKFAES